MRLKSLLIPVAMLLVSSAISFALQFPEMGTDEMKKLFDSKTKFVLVDSRPLDEYASGHIAGAINIAPDQLTFVRAFLPADRNVQLVIYCRGFGWNLSQSVAVAAMNSGYANIKIYQAGYPEWTQKGYPTETGFSQNQVSGGA